MRQPVECSHRKLDVLLLGVLELRVREPTEALDEQHHGRHAGASDLGRVVERAARQPVRRARDFPDRLVGELDQPLVEEDRLDVPDPLPLDLDVLFLGKPPRGCLRVAQHLRQLDGVEMPLVEQALGGLDDRGDDAWFRHHAAHRADGALSDPLGDLTDLQLEPGRTGERVATLVHRGRARVGRLAAKGHLVALDAERPQYDPERQVERLQNRTLLDVELEVGGGVLELASSFEGGVEIDIEAGDCVGQRDALSVLALPQLVLVGHRGGGRRRAEQRAAEARALLVGPVDEPDGDRRRPLLGDPAQDLDAGHHVERSVEPAAVRDRVDVPADQQRPFRVARQREPLVAGRVDLLLGTGTVELSAEPFAGALPRIGPSDPLGAVFVAGQLLKLSQLCDGAAWIEHLRDRKRLPRVW